MFVYYTLIALSEVEYLEREKENEKKKEILEIKCLTSTEFNCLFRLIICKIKLIIL